MAAGLPRACSMKLELTGKRVLVTGSSKGIGRAIATRFLDEGSSVVITSRGEENLTQLERHLKSEYGDSKVLAKMCDCSDLDSLESLKKKINKEWHGLDIVIANAGNGKSVPDPLPSKKQWAQTWKSNFETALNTSRVFIPSLRESKGCLLFISSIAAMEAFGAPVDYSTSKAAVIALAKNLSRKLAQEIRINTLAPGNIYFHGGSWDEKMQENSEHVKAIIENSVPMKRFGTLDEISDAALFLCSNRASFINGSTLVVDGGQTVGVL